MPLCSQSTIASKPPHIAVQPPHPAQRRRTPGSTQGPCCGDRSEGRRRVRLCREATSTSTLWSHSSHPVPQGATSVCPGVRRTHTIAYGGHRAGIRTQGQGELCQEVPQGLEAMLSSELSSRREGTQGCCCWMGGRTQAWRTPTLILWVCCSLSSMCPWASHRPLTLRILSCLTILRFF